MHEATRGDEPAGRIERWGPFVVVALVVAFSLLASWRKPLWLDEIFTLLVARRDGPVGIWQGLLGGMDNHPPINYLLAQLSIRSFGESPFSARLPSLIAFVVALLAVQRFVARRSGAASGLIAMLFLATSAGLPYAFEARGYAPVLCFSALALVAWQAAGERPRHIAASLGLALCLCAAQWTHFYGVLLLFPLALGEAARCWSRRRIDPGVLLALGLGALNLIGVYLFVQSSPLREPQKFWASAHSPLDILDVHAQLLGPMLAPLLLVTLLGSVPWVAQRNVSLSFDLAVSLGFLLLPIAMWVMAELVTGAFHFRYVLFTVVGAAAAIGMAVATGDKRRDGLCATLLLAWLPVHLAVAYRDVPNNAATRAMLEFVNELPPGVVVVDAQLEFVPAWYQADPQTRSRFRHLYDAAASMKYIRSETQARTFSAMQRFVDLGVQPAQEFVRENPNFLLVSSVGFDAGWLLPWLVEDVHARVTLVREHKPFLAYQVEIPSTR